MTGMGEITDPSAMQAQLFAFPDDVLRMLFPDVQVNRSTISTEDQIQTMELVGNLDQDDTEAVQESFDDLPESVSNAMYTDIVVEQTVITGEDQSEIMKLLAELDTEDSEAALEVMDRVYSYPAGL